MKVGAVVCLTHEFPVFVPKDSNMTPLIPSTRISVRAAVPAVVFIASLGIASLGSACHAGLVGNPVTFSVYQYGVLDTATTFLVSSVMPEYYASYGSPQAWNAFGVDVNENSMTFTGDFGGALQTNVAFAPGVQFRLTLPASMQVTSFTVGSSSSVTNLEQSDLSYAANVLIFDAEYVSINTVGGGFTLNFTTIPGPSSLVAIAALAARTRARRR